MNKETKWSIYRYGQDNIELHDQDSNNVLSWLDVGIEQAERNAILCSQAPEWREIAQMFYEAVTDNVVDIRRAIYKYEQICKEEDI